MILKDGMVLNILTFARFYIIQTVYPSLALTELTNPDTKLKYLLFNFVLNLRAIPKIIITEQNISNII